MTRDELIEKIDITKKAIQFAGPVHRRDLRKHLKRMLAQVAQYDRYQAAARQGVGSLSFCILMALNVVFSNVWGIILKEWKGCSQKTITVLIVGIVVLIVSSFLPQLI